MKIISTVNYRGLLLAIFTAVLSIIMPLFANAQNLSVTEVKVGSIENNSAVISWKTPNEKTAGIIYVGESENKFDMTLRSDSYAYSHQVTVKNIDKNKTYFYKIVVVDKAGNRRELFIRSFSTKQMIDTNEPEIIDLEVVQSTYEAIVLRWTTSEETSGYVNYGIDRDDLKKKAGVGNFATVHEVILYNIESGKKYYFKVTATDKDKNTVSKIISATSSGSKSRAKLEITDIQPISFDSSRISARTAVISFKTSMVAKSKILYGTNPKKLTEKIIVSDFRDFMHEIELKNLKPLTTYFFTVQAYDSLYGKTAISELMSFETGNVRVRYPSGSLVRAKGDQKVYLIYKDTKAWIENPAVFLGLGFKGEWIEDVDAYTLDDYEEIKSINSAKSHPNGVLIKYPGKATVWFIDGNRQRPIGSPEAFTRNGFKWDRIILITDSRRYMNGEYLS